MDLLAVSLRDKHFGGFVVGGFLRGGESAGAADRSVCMAILPFWWSKR